MLVALAPHRAARKKVADLCVCMCALPSRFSRDRPRFTDTLDVIKFVCKDMWTLLFRKQIDNLKTNHRVRSYPPCHCHLSSLPSFSPWHYSRTAWKS